MLFLLLFNVFDLVSLCRPWVQPVNTPLVVPVMKLDSIEWIESTADAEPVDPDQVIELEIDLANRMVKLSSRNIKWFVVFQTVIGLLIYYCSEL